MARESYVARWSIDSFTNSLSCTHRDKEIEKFHTSQEKSSSACKFYSQSGYSRRGNQFKIGKKIKSFTNV